MTWRERIAAARERGAFTEKDVDDIGVFTTCMVGEASASVIGVDFYDPFFANTSRRLRLGAYGIKMPGHDPIGAVMDNAFDEADRCLDRIQDAALRIKLEMGT